MNVMRVVPGWKSVLRALEESDVITQNRIARGHDARPRFGGECDDRRT